MDRSEYPLAETGNGRFLPEKPLQVNSLIKWDVSEPITVAIKKSDSIADDALSNLDSAIEQIRKLVPELDLRRVPPKDSPTELSHVHADITAHFYNNAAGPFSSWMGSKLIIEDVQEFKKHHELYDVFEYSFEAYKEPYTRVNENFFLDGVLRFDHQGQAQNAICNPIGWKLSPPAEEYFLECLLSALGMPNREKTIEDAAQIPLLLKVLYDPRLEAGMTKDEAGPIVREIIADMFPK